MTGSPREWTIADDAQLRVMDRENKAVAIMAANLRRPVQEVLKRLVDLRKKDKPTGA